MNKISNSNMLVQVDPITIFIITYFFDVANKQMPADTNNEYSRGDYDINLRLCRPIIRCRRSPGLLRMANHH